MAPVLTISYLIAIAYKKYLEQYRLHLGDNSPENATIVVAKLNGRDTSLEPIDADSFEEEIEALTAAQKH